MYQFRARSARTDALFSNPANWTNNAVPVSGAEIKMLGVNDTLIVDGVYTVDQIIITKAGQKIIPSSTLDTLRLTGNGKTQMLSLIHI